MFSCRNRVNLAFACALACGVACALTSGATPAAALSTVQDQSDLDLTGQFAISSFLAADDLNFPAARRIDTVTVWLADSVANNNGVPDGFSGSLSWAIYSDDSGPAELLWSGIDTTPQLGDTGFQTDDGHDVFRARIDLDGRPLVGPARGWLVIHEGAWGSPIDGSPIYWITSAATAGSAAYVTGNETNPTPAEWFPALYDPAFVVESDPHDWFQGTIDPGNTGNISHFVCASDFVLPSPRRIDSLDAWIADLGPANGQLDGFSGTLSWAINSDAAGFPGGLVASGKDATAEVFDADLPPALGGDIARIRIELSPGPTLPAGTWWLALHEGDWGSAGDGSAVRWVASSPYLNSSARQTQDEANPGSWYVQDTDRDLAFVLFDDSIFASGFDAGTTCAWSAAVGGATCP